MYKDNPYRHKTIEALNNFCSQMNPLIEELPVKEEIELKTESPELKSTILNPEGVIWELERENKTLRRLLVDKMLELEEEKDDE